MFLHTCVQPWEATEPHSYVRPSCALVYVGVVCTPTAFSSPPMSYTVPGYEAAIREHLGVLVATLKASVFEVLDAP